VECRKRFQKLVDEEKELEEKFKPVSESVVVEPPSEIPDALEDARVDPPPVDSIFDDEGEITVALPYVSGAATLPQTSPSCAELCRDSLPVFGAQPMPACPAVNQPPKSNNNRQKRRALKKSQRPNEGSTLFEFACSLNSQLGLASDQCNINHIGLSKERIDLGDENQCSQLDYQISEAAKVAPPHLWSSIPCTSGSPLAVY